MSRLGPMGLYGAARVGSIEAERLIQGGIVRAVVDEKRERLPSIEGRVPDMTRPPAGCRFAARCPFVEPACRDAEPALVEVAPGHLTRCRRAPLAEVLR